MANLTKHGHSICFDLIKPWASCTSRNLRLQPFPVPLNVSYDYNDCIRDYFSNLDGFWSSFQLITTMTYFVFPIWWLVFHDVYIFFTTLCIRLITHATKIITLYLHKVCMLFCSYMYRLFNSTYIPLCLYIPTKYLPI
jgi:hypothetical protein